MKLLNVNNTIVKPLTHFLESKQYFLEGIERRVKEILKTSSKDVLLSMIQRENNGKYFNYGHETDDDETMTVNNKVFFTADDETKSKWDIYAFKNVQNLSQYDAITLKMLLQAGVHYGHRTPRMHPHMTPYVAGKHSGIHVINLDKTLPMLKVACVAIKEMAARGARIVWVGTKSIAQRLTYECAMACDAYFVNQRWLGGTITNKENVLGSRRLHNYGDILTPDLLVVLDYKNNTTAIKEASDANIPTIAICDTDCDPLKVTYPIPANDDGLASVELIGRVLAQAAWDGKNNTNGNNNAEGSMPHAAMVASAEKFIRKYNPMANPFYSEPIRTPQATTPSASDADENA